MADAKITALTALTDPAVADILPIVDDVAGTPITKKVTLQSLVDLFAVTAPINISSMYSQAINNGNFDVWSTITSGVLANNDSMADQFRVIINLDGGTPPVVTTSKQIITPGDINGAFNYYNINVNGAGSGYGTSAQYSLRHLTEFGTRILAGTGNKVTLSFWAKSDIAGKKMSPFLTQNYGTGGSPSAEEYLPGTTITLTSTWTKYTQTFTLNTLVGKTFGTNLNDFITTGFCLVWGTAVDQYFGTETSAETWVGSGNICIDQVKLNLGSVALPFQPKSVEEEKRACRRYKRVFKSTALYSVFAVGGALSTTAASAFLLLDPPMRITPTLVATASEWAAGILTTSVQLTSMSIDASLSSPSCVGISMGVASGLTAHDVVTLNAYAATDKYFVLNAEL